MKADYPGDADGDALRRVRDDGSNMSRPMDIDFAVVAPSKSAGESIAERIAGKGYKVQLHQDAESATWTCYCTRRMVADYDAVVAAQSELDELSKPFGGYSDGWGTTGNVEEQRH